MKIKELYLKNFRCFEETKIDFDEDYTIFVGINGAGKSSILNAIQIMLYPIMEVSQYDIRNAGTTNYPNIKEKKSEISCDEW